MYAFFLSLLRINEHWCKMWLCYACKNSACLGDGELVRSKVLLHFLNEIDISIIIILVYKYLINVINFKNMCVEM